VLRAQESGDAHRSPKPSAVCCEHGTVVHRTKRADDWIGRLIQRNPSMNEAARLWTAASIAAFRFRRFKMGTTNGLASCPGTSSSGHLSRPFRAPVHSDSLTRGIGRTNSLSPGLSSRSPSGTGTLLFRRTPNPEGPTANGLSFCPLVPLVPSCPFGPFSSPAPPQKVCPFVHFRSSDRRLPIPFVYSLRNPDIPIPTINSRDSLFYIVSAGHAGF